MRQTTRRRRCLQSHFQSTVQHVLYAARVASSGMAFDANARLVAACVEREQDSDPAAVLTMRGAPWQHDSSTDGRTIVSSFFFPRCATHDAVPSLLV
jgi:hypothetical protein